MKLCKMIPELACSRTQTVHRLFMHIKHEWPHSGLTANAVASSHNTHSIEMQLVLSGMSKVSEHPELCLDGPEVN